MTRSARNDEYLITNIDKAINELVFNKWKLQKAYNYYNGKRDAEQFRYLEENFGIGNPTSVEFTPLIKKHVDALIGEYLDTPLLPKVSCKDEETISKITRDKELLIVQQVYNFLQRHLNNQILSFIGNGNISDASIESEINKLIEDINTSFISNYEKAAQNVIEYILQSRHTDIKNKLKLLLLDLLVTGCSFYRVIPSLNASNITVEVLNPLNTFIDRNPESPYVQDSYRAVIRKWMTKQQILNEYGKDLDDDSIDELEDMYENYSDSSYLYIRAMENQVGCRPIDTGEGAGLDAGKGVVPGFPADTYESFNYKLLPVYETEWIAVDKEGGDYVQNRYEGVRIGQSIYVLKGKSKNVIRTKDAPTKCGLSVNGIYLVNRDNVPQSLVLQCAHLQDKYDLITYLRDNVLANSGTSGDWVDLSMLPTILGDDLTERLQKFIAYKKSGLALVDTSQEGRAFNNNTTFSGFDDSIKIQTMQAFDLALQRVEDQTSSITGVFRERLNGIQQRDAVSNVEAGARNSYIITKPFYQTMDTLVIDILGDCLNMAKIVWKRKGLTGTLILGDKLQKIFTALPEHFTHTDYDIHIVPSTQIMKEMQNVQQIIIELIKSGQLEPDAIVDALTARSLTELKSKVTEAFNKFKKEHNSMQQLQQQLEQLQQQNQQLQQQLQQAQSKIESLNEAKLDIERQKVQNEADINWYNARTQRDKSQSDAENDTKRTDIEYAQMFDGNQMNNEIKNL